MNIEQLISVLQKYDPKARVIVQGYEEGYCDIHSLKEVPIKLDVHSEDYNGPHEKVDKSDADETAVWIMRDDVNS